METPSQQAPFDFDYWAELAVNEPEKFEAERLRVTEELIREAPVERQQRLRGLQWRVDLEVKRSKNPMESCLRIHQMMMEKVFDKGGLVEKMNQLVDLVDGRTTHSQQKRPTDAANDDKSVINLSEFKQR